VFAIDYRLATADTPTWDKAPQDLACALGWVQQNSERYNLDPSQISLGGMSAGGILALGTAYRLDNGTIGSSCGQPPAPPASVVGFYPGVDVTKMWEDDVEGSREAAAWFTGGTPDEVPERYREVSPSTYVEADLPRTLLVVGDRDRSANPDDVTGLGDSLAESGTEVITETLPFAVHAFDDAYGSVTAQASRQIILEFLTGDTQ
jgi:acetyl esterase/lipase